MQGRPPHLVGKAFLDRFGIPPDSADAYAFTSVDFEKSAQRFGKLGGFAHLKTLADRLRGDVGQGRALLLDGGDLWQGTGLANAMQGADMVEAANLLGIDVILGGHTHDAVPQPIAVRNAGGTTLVTNAGSNGKFLGVLDLELAKGKIGDLRYRLLPVYSELLKPDPAMEALVEKLHATHDREWNNQVGTADRLLYRRGNFSGSMDQLICGALRGELDAEIALSPGFRWGVTALAGQALTMEDLLAETAITYAATYVQSMTGGQIKDVLEDVCDNLFNADPYYQQGGDMVRVGGLSYTCTPAEGVGRRISELTLDSGHRLEPGKHYKVAGWASINEQQGKPVWDVFADHLRARRTAAPRGNGVILKGVDGNPGIA